MTEPSDTLTFRDRVMECADLRKQLAECRAERDRLRAKCVKVIAWLLRLADCAEKQAAQRNQFDIVKEACEADAKNYRATAKDIQAALEPEPAEDEPAT